jgi:hypothetical protein
MNLLNISDVSYFPVFIPILFDGTKPPPNCTGMNDSGVCIKYNSLDDILKNKLPSITQQTFTKNINTTKNIWIQDYPPKPKNTILNSDNTTSSIAPICIIKTPNCTSENIINKCEITCMSTDNTNQHNYIFNTNQNSFTKKT